MTWPIDDLTTVNLDQGTDDPSQARAELLAAVQKVKAILSQRGATDGIAGLDASAKIANSFLYVGGGNGLDADTLDGLHAAAFAQAADVQVLGGRDIVNGDFEVDSDADGLPDSWSITTYPGGTASLETTAPISGSQSLKFVHPGGVGNGGGYADSDYLVAQDIEKIAIRFLIKSTAAGIKNEVYVRWYDESKVYISVSLLYISTANPTNTTEFRSVATPPSGARFLKIRLLGGSASVNVAGTTYFDGISVERVYDKSVRTQTFLSSGSFTVPQGVWEVTAICQGGGGGGAGFSAPNPTAGNAGSCVVSKINTSPGDTLTVTVGGGGTGGSSTTTGGTGGSSSVTGAITAAGGIGGGLDIISQKRSSYPTGYGYAQGSSGVLPTSSVTYGGSGGGSGHYGVGGANGVEGVGGAAAANTGGGGGQGGFLYPTTYYAGGAGGSGRVVLTWRETI